MDHDQDRLGSWAQKKGAYATPFIINARNNKRIPPANNIANPSSFLLSHLSLLYLFIFSPLI